MAEYLDLSGPQRRALLEAALAEHGWICCICGLSIQPGTESLQHLISRSRGGSDERENLRPAHRSCNYQAQDRPMDGPAGQVHNGLGYWTRPEAYEVRPLAVTGAPPRLTRGTPSQDEGTTSSDAGAPLPGDEGTPSRRVTLLCGPPGAGKADRARSLAEAEQLEILDCGSEQWKRRGAEQLEAALLALGDDEHARAVVIIAGATRAARVRASAKIDATDMTIMTATRAELVASVRDRATDAASVKAQIRAVDSWLSSFEPAP